MPAVNSSGTQTAVIGTEHTLATVTSPGTYVLKVRKLNMVAGDTLEIRIYDKVLAGSPSEAVYKGTFTDAPSADDLVAISVPMVTTHEFKATLKQTTGTGRSFDWEIVVA